MYFSRTVFYEEENVNKDIEQFNIFSGTTTPTGVRRNAS
jgi:hypothetical protein